VENNKCVKLSDEKTAKIAEIQAKIERLNSEFNSHKIMAAGDKEKCKIESHSLNKQLTETSAELTKAKSQQTETSSRNEKLALKLQATNSKLDTLKKQIVQTKNQARKRAQSDLERQQASDKIRQSQQQTLKEITAKEGKLQNELREINDENSRILTKNEDLLREIESLRGLIFCLLLLILFFVLCLLCYKCFKCCFQSKKSSASNASHTRENSGSRLLS